MSDISPVDEYQDFAEVLTEIKEVLLVDLVPSTLRLPELYKESLIDEPPGIYTIGGLEPIVSFEGNIGYWSKEAFDKREAIPDIIEPIQFIEHQGPIVNEAGRIINPYWRAARHGVLQPYCSFNYAAVHIACCHVWDILRSLSKHTRPTTHIPKRNLEETTWVKRTHLCDYYETCNMVAERHFAARVLDFVGDDYFNLYQLELNNTTIKVTKGNDFRVIDYYRRIFDEFENNRFETRGY